MVKKHVYLIVIYMGNVRAMNLRAQTFPFSITAVSNEIVTKNGRFSKFLVTGCPHLVFCGIDNKQQLIISGRFSGEV